MPPQQDIDIAKREDSHAPRAVDVLVTLWVTARRLILRFANVSQLNVSEIQADSALRRYAYAVIGGHFVVWVFFVDTGILRVLHASVEPLCWPYFENCWTVRFENTLAISLIPLGYLVLTVAALTQLIARRIYAFWYCLLATNVYLAMVVSLDYRLRANEFYMLFWLNGVFLAVPAKRWTIPIIIVSFYFWAGRLKLNAEWLTGAVLYGDLWLIPKELVWLACWYVVVLEIVFIWGLLARRRVIQYLTLLQLALFHVQSLSQIHWFYPALMATILSWFILSCPVHRADRASIGINALFRGSWPSAAYVVSGVFAFCQLVPLMYAGDPALSGHGRIIALHMFEARQVCEVYAVVKHTNGSAVRVDIKLPQLPPRSVCDPVVYYNRVRNMCRESQPGLIEQIGFVMRVRRSTQPDLRTIVNEQSFCGDTVDYSVVFKNGWLH